MYVSINKTNDQFMNSHGRTILIHFDISLNDGNKCLSSIYWLPKLHEIPIKIRLIIAAPKFSINPLSKCITFVLKLTFKQIESYYKQSFFFSGVTSFSEILKNQSVIDSVKNLNGLNKAESVTCYDVLTLYTNIPHGKPIGILNEHIDFCFKGDGGNSM